MSLHVSTKNLNIVKKYQRGLSMVLVMIVFFAVVTLATVILFMSQNTLESEVSHLVTINNYQLKINIDSYLKKIETTSTLIFSDPTYYEYDDTKAKDALDKMYHQQAINNRIVDLGMIDNYSDFGIVYANNAMVGWISDDAKDIFGGKTLYKQLKIQLENNDQEGWFSGVKGNYRHLYYVKQVNKHAILLLSVYTEELEKLFEHPDTLNDMVIRMVDQENRVIYSTDAGEIGKKLPNSISSYIDKNDIVSAMSNDDMITGNVLHNNWKVVCSIPKSVLFQTMYKTRIYLVAFSVCCIFVCLIILFITVRRVTKPMDGYMDDLSNKASVDELSGILNKATYQEKAERRIRCRKSNQTLIFAMLDIDNFKQINDHLGHAYGDEVIHRMGKLINDFLGEDAISGRVGGDEFSFLLTIENPESLKISQEIQHKMAKLLECFANEFQTEKETLGVSLSVGLRVIENTDQIRYDDAYVEADYALYQAKTLGKDQFMIYKEEHA